MAVAQITRQDAGPAGGQCSACSTRYSPSLPPPGRRVGTLLPHRLWGAPLMAPRRWGRVREYAPCWDRAETAVRSRRGCASYSSLIGSGENPATADRVRAHPPPTGVWSREQRPRRGHAPTPPRGGPRRAGGRGHIPPPWRWGRGLLQKPPPSSASPTPRAVLRVAGSWVHRTATALRAGAVVQ